jgi:hypothetical protein
MVLSSLPVGVEFRINTFITDSQGSPSVAMDASGDFVVTWQSLAQDGSNAGIYAQRFNAAGVAQGTEFRVNTFTADAQNFPSVAMNAGGDFVIAWTSLGQDGSAEGIYAQRYNASGMAQGGEFRVNTVTTGRQITPAVAMDVTGDFVVAWADDTRDRSLFGVYAQRYNAAGAAQGGEFRVNTFTTGSQLGPAVAMDPAGHFVVSWHSIGQDGSSGGIYAARFNAAGVPQDLEFRVNSFTTGDQQISAVALDADGDFVITWNRNGSGDDSGTFARRFNSTGVAQGDDFRVNTFTTNVQTSTGIAMNAAGDFVITWSSLTQDGSGTGTYARQYSPAGVPQGDEFRVNTFTTGEQSLPAVAMADGNFVVTWTGSGSGDSAGVFAQRYVFSSAPAPQVTGSSFLFETSLHRLQFVFSQSVAASLTTADLVLENLTTSTTIPSSDIALGYNAATNTATFIYTGSGGGITGVLPDGRYRATLVAAGIRNTDDIALPANHVFNFVFLAGDADNDGTVDITDLGILATNWQQSTRTFSQGDFNYDATVDITDLGILATKWQQSLPAALASRAHGPGAYRRTITLSQIIQILQ